MSRVKNNLAQKWQEEKVIYGGHIESGRLVRSNAIPPMDTGTFTREKLEEGIVRLVGIDYEYLEPRMSRNEQKMMDLAQGYVMFHKDVLKKLFYTSPTEQTFAEYVSFTSLYQGFDRLRRAAQDEIPKSYMELFE